ncbi:pre-mRNA-splicing factor cwc24-like [Asparagus officinalis]|nr:pre-mRNA-splicing factor cwc24-like [Asparagus officinalis]
MNESGSKSGSIRDSDNGTVNWKSFKDRIRLRRAGNAWSEPESEYYPPPNPNPLFARSFSGKPADEDPPVSGEPAKMSLMALFEQTEGGGFGSEEDEDDDDDEDYDDGDDDGDGDDGGDEGMYNACCVCMVRHKGPAFIPCGHTFCRLCSKELFVSRGNCPLCNGFILEILNIF